MRQMYIVCCPYNRNVSLLFLSLKISSIVIVQWIIKEFSYLSDLKRKKYDEMITGNCEGNYIENLADVWRHCTLWIQTHTLSKIAFFLFLILHRFKVQEVIHGVNHMKYIHKYRFSNNISWIFFIVALIYRPIINKSVV